MATEEHVQISDFSDRELMAIIGESSGPVTPKEIALRIFGIEDVEENEKGIRHAARCVVSRFSWMRRYGLLDRNEEGFWEISEDGEALRKGSLPKVVESGIEGAKEASVLVLAHVVGRKLLVAEKVSGRAMQRELQYQIGQRKVRVREW